MVAPPRRQPQEKKATPLDDHFWSTIGGKMLYEVELAKATKSMLKAARTAHEARSPQLLLEYLGLSKTEDKRLESDPSVVLVAIDTENHQAVLGNPKVPTGSFQLGVAILDTRDLEASSASSDDLISTYNFVMGEPEPRQAANAIFLFGERATIERHEIASVLRGLIPRSRNIVIAGHGFATDLKALRFVGADLTTSVIGYLDTEIIAKKVLSADGYKLGNLVKELKLQCPTDALHSAGNDAHFALRCLLLLAARIHGQTSSVGDAEEKSRALVERLEAIGRSRIPEKKPRPQAPEKVHQFTQHKPQIIKRTRADIMAWREEFMATCGDISWGFDSIMSPTPLPEPDGDHPFDTKMALGIAERGADGSGWVDAEEDLGLARILDSDTAEAE